MTLFTLSRQDVYNFGRCPKIVAIKSYRTLHPPERTQHAARAEPEVPASVIGKIGEAAIVAAFSPAAIAAQSLAKMKDLISKQASSAVTRMGLTMDENTQLVLEQTVDGLAEIRSYIIEEYGDVQVIGRGGCKNGPFPGDARPDFVALSPKFKRPIIIEAKNTPKPVSTDRFQATFYNTVARQTGVIVHEERIENGQPNLVPVAYHESIAETLLVYPRAGTYERVEDQIDLKEGTLKSIWEAKQLGFMGKSPHTECGFRCPHHRLGLDLPEGSLETALPLPLIYAQGLIGADADLDTDYLHNYFYKSGLADGMFDFIISAEREQRQKTEVITQIAKKTGIPIDVVERMVFTRPRTPSSDKIFKEMASYIEPWEKVFGKERLQRSGPSVSAQATKIFTLPSKSDEFVKRSWKKWQ